MGGPRASLTSESIAAAATRIPVELRGSPQFLSDGLSALVGRPVIAKVDTVNPVGAFKGRGAWLAVDAAVAEGRAGPERPVVVASTGNFAQAISYAGRAHGVPVVVFAAESADRRKLDRIRLLGAELLIEGRDFDQAREASRRFARARDALLLVDGEDPWTAIGAGSLAMEVTAARDEGSIPAFGAAVVPVGNGALIAGLGTWLRHAAPSTRVLGVQSEKAPAMTLSWRAGRVIETAVAATRAGGLATRVPVPEALEMMAGVVDDMLLVSEDEIASATTEMTRALGITAELAAGATLAASLRYPTADGAVLLVVSGANAEAP